MKLPSRRHLTQFLEYWVGGGVFFWSGYITFSVLYGLLHWRWWHAKILGDIVGWTLNYLVQRYWAFASSTLQKHENVNRSRYVVLSVIDTGLDYVIVGGLVWLGMSPYLGAFVSSAFFTIWNYAWYRFWVFADGPVEQKEYNKS